MYKLTKPLSRLLLAGAAILPILTGLCPQAHADIRDGLTAYWNFDNEDFLDSVGVFHGAESGAEPIAFVDGKPGFGKAAKLDGNDQEIEIIGGEPDDLAFAGGSMSISVWFKVDAWDTDWQAIIAKGENNNWRVHRRGAEQGVAFAGGTSDTPAGPGVNDGLWHHLVAIVDRDAVDFGTAVYVDGVRTAMLGGVPNLTANGQRVRIGENPDAPGREFEGELDDIAIWDRVLTEEEIASLYRDGEGSPLNSFFGTKIEILGLGAAALLGGDLTDPENDGDEGAYPGPTWNGNAFFGNNEAAFGGGEFAFNVFDNDVGGGNDKWCCDDPSEANPLWVGVSFPRAASITHFTVTSGNDTPGRDPRRWKLQGSNNGETWEDIFVQDADTPLWTDRNQVIKITLAAPSAAYQQIRYFVTDTAEPLHQLNEIELFGSFGGASIPRFAGSRATRTTISLLILDGLDTILDPTSVAVKIDGVTVSTTHSKVDTTTTFVYDNGARYDSGSLHTFELTGRDSVGNPLAFSGSVRIPVPWFPDEDLPGPAPEEGLWGLRYIFGAGTIDSIPSALAQIQAAATEAFTGRMADVTTQTANFPVAGGFFGNGNPYHEEATMHPDGGWNGEDFIQLFIGHLVIEEESDYTFGVHSDDGFALRIRGGTAVAVSGNGQLDQGDPEAVLHPANTGDSNTRGVYHLKPGIYRIEFFWWERGGGDNGELYAAKGRFANDADTDEWKLVGDPTPGAEYIQLGVDENGWRVVSSDPGGDVLANWTNANADLEATAGEPVNYDIGSWGDPDTNGGIPAFPKNGVGDQDNFALRATAKLVVPQDGTWVIGFNSDDGGYVKIAGQTFSSITVNATGASVIPEGSPDTVICDCLTGDSNTRAEITLAKGSYDIEAGMFEQGGGAFLTVRGAQSDAPRVPVLSKNGVGTFKTGEPLQLTAAAVGLGNIILSIEISGANAILTFKPVVATATYRVVRSTDLRTWATVDVAPVAVGGNLQFTVPLGGSVVFFGVQKQ